NAVAAESVSAAWRGTPASRATAATAPRFAHSTSPTAAAAASPATRLGDGAGSAEGVSSARSGATVTERTRTGASGEPANTRAATAVSTTGDAQVATARRVAVPGLEREVGTARKAHVVRVATSVAAQATSHTRPAAPVPGGAVGGRGTAGVGPL